MSSAWRVEERVGEASVLHAGWPSVEADPARRALSVCRVASTAVVLGSTQSDSVVDGDQALAGGVSVARRRSGGGAVLVTAGEPAWIDAWVPAGDALALPDVARAFDWLGDTWVEALGRVGVDGLAAHRGGYLTCTRWSSLVCFGGVGSGEVVTDDGRKVVGLAQRRNRDGAWFHSACVLRWDPRPLVDLLALARSEKEAAVSGLGAAVIGAADLAGQRGIGRPDAADLASALIASLP